MCWAFAHAGRSVLEIESGVSDAGIRRHKASHLLKAEAPSVML
jgi:hypothetical protein